MSVILLNYKARTEYTEQVLQSIGQEEVYIVDRLGISAAINEGVQYFFEVKKYDYVFICANDIRLPLGWKHKALEAYQNIPDTGMAAIYCVETLPEPQVINGVKVHPAWGVFGDCMITRKAFEMVGYWNEAQDNYGMNDSDYCYRLHKAGLLNYYLSDIRAEHLGNDVGNSTEYRKMKDEGLSVALDKFNTWKVKYDAGELYLPYNQTQSI